MIEVRIGIVEAPKELVLEIDDEAENVEKLVDQSLGQRSSTGETSLLWLNDSKHKRVGIPVDKIAYVEISTATRPVGFGPS